MSVEDLEKIIDPARRESGLVLDRFGRWHHEGAPVTHSRLEAVLHRWIDRDEATGRYVLRAGREWCFVEVEDTPLFVRGVVLDGEGSALRVTLRLSDGSSEELDYGSLRQAEDNVLYCDARGGRLAARFDRAAYFDLGERVEIDEAGPVLPAAGRRWPILAIAARSASGDAGDR